MTRQARRRLQREIIKRHSEAQQPGRGPRVLLAALIGAIAVVGAPVITAGLSPGPGQVSCDQVFVRVVDEARPPGMFAVLTAPNGQRLSLLDSDPDVRRCGITDAQVRKGLG